MDSHTVPSTTEPFDSTDVAQFTADDTEAGQAICKMLSLFFAYTLLVMILSTLVTVYWTSR